MINTILNELASNNSRLFKEEILNKHKNNDILKQVVFLALDPFTQFYQRKIPPYLTPQVQDQESLVWAMSQLNVLSSREKTGHAAIDHLQMILSSISSDDAKVIERIIEKDLNCGVSESTANKVWPNLIHEFPVMLCAKLNDKVIEKMAWPAYSQLKLDGMRCAIIVKDGKVDVRSRNGKEIQVHGHFDYFADFADNMVFDGELMVKDVNGNFLDRKTGNGILNKCVKGTITPAETSFIHIVLYDMINHDDFIKGKSSVTYVQRYEDLKVMCFGQNSSCSLVLNYITYNLEEAEEVFQLMLLQGQEGIILKNLNGIWENKRSNSLIKFKAELDADMEVIGWEEGTGRLEGKMGALTVASADRKIIVNVGTGFSDEQRTEFTKEATLGKIVAIQYNARIKSKNSDVEKLFLPVFLEIRLDKDTADNSKDFK